MQPLSGHFPSQVTCQRVSQYQSPLFFTALVDTKNRNRSSEEFKAAIVGMFCNGDVEGRFSKGV